MKRYHLLVSGRVQGVGFRYTASHLADLYNLTGWVKNRYDGDVEMEIQGDPGNMAYFLDKLKTQSRWIRIDRIDKKEIPCDDHETVFHVRFS
ncbi:acylphosphatase [Pseudoramibacter sp.]|uniref:acylphosphatase n=1 Tax=Pseudoramibacter sp. TaxID=2034862 RepID=UPI00345A105C